VKRSLTVTGVLLTSALLVAACSQSPVIRTPTPSGSAPGNAVPNVLPRVLAGGLSDPWELAWGPDDYLWVTEKTGKRVTRINPADGSSTEVLAIPAASASGAEDGVLGMAFAPGAVFLAYDYDAATGPNVDLRGKIVRYSYDQSAASLSNPTDVITGLPASTANNGGRLVLGPDQKLYFTIGDQGNNEYSRACTPIRAQDLPSSSQVATRDWSSYTGKVLRLNQDGTVPADNPLIRGVRSHIFSYGHRDPDGLAFGADGQLYSDEIGPKSDDEVNLLRAGENYGWPYVAGYRDDQSYRYANWSAARGCGQLGYDPVVAPASVPRGLAETQWDNPDYVDPLKTLFTVPNGYNFQDPACGPGFARCWPSVEASSLTYLGPDTPDQTLANSLLVPSLRNGAVYALKLTKDGGSVQGNVLQLFRTHNRYRDIAVSPDRTKIYVAATSASQGPGTGEQSAPLDAPGAILEFALAAPDDAPRPLRGVSPTPKAPAESTLPSPDSPTFSSGPGAAGAPGVPGRPSVAEQSVPDAGNQVPRPTPVAPAGQPGTRYTPGPAPVPAPATR
jgi:PQQ-dependent dehydrogenase (s-GDH family)